MEHISGLGVAQRGDGDTQEGGSNTAPLMIVTLLFFLWGLLTSLNDVLIPHLKAVYSLNYVQAMLVQFCFFGAYFIVSLPAGMLIKRLGYQNGAVAGLVIAAGGCALFYPASTGGYGMFLFAFFVLAAGITVLQVAANPYVTVLGDPATASSRLSLTQAFNSLGTAIAPTLGGLLILSGGVLTEVQFAQLPSVEQVAYQAQQAGSVRGPYLALCAALLMLAVLFALVRLPKIAYADTAAQDQAPDAPLKASLFSYRHLVLGAIGIFVYVGAEVSIGSFLINFLGEADVAGLAPSAAAHYVSYYWGGAMVGRFIGFAVMRYISPGKTLAFNAAVSIALILLAILSKGHVAMWAVIAVGVFNSVMFPTIFSMALNGLGRFTGQGSGVLCMAIVGGAIVPFVQGYVADVAGLYTSFLVPAVCYCYIVYFGVKYAAMYRNAPKA
ncbi:sugar MFS transporter [Duganella sp. HH105]|uniref:sugar MFS transporter n=1 Tax=Duganella sp. HH105 TaxID=1781067 RepID=UPI000877B312|nr:sugar MFS transporter [Duganella sp. HH105]OEZ63514.1 L-fucose-proton symporter [Duganella sp. HH105]